MRSRNDPRRWFRSLQRRYRSFISESTVRPLPITSALGDYRLASVGPDFKAGLNVALLAFPQGIAYAAIAGLPVQYGLYASAVAAVIGALFGGSRFIVLGPTNATSVMLFASFLGLGVTQADKVAMMPLLLLLVGLFLLVGALLQIANLIQYVSRSVITGYITAAAVYIFLNQVRKALGFEFEIPSGATFFDVVWLTAANAGLAESSAVACALLTALCYLGLNRLLPRLPNVAVTLVVMSAVAWGYHQLLALSSVVHPALTPLETLQPIPAGTWVFTLPAYNDKWVGLLAPVALIIAFLSVLEGSSIGKTLAARAGERLDANQEMYGMGMANIGCALAGGMPASGSLTRSQLNFVSGCRSPLAALVSGGLVAGGALALSPLIGYIPVPVLAVLVMAIALTLISPRMIRIVVKATFNDRVVFLTTFLAALLVRLDFAIILGAATSILLFLRKAAKPELVEYGYNEAGELAQVETGMAIRRAEPEISILHVEGDLFFGASELFRDQMRRVFQDENLRVVILKLRNAHHLDATSVLALEDLARYMRERERYLLVTEVRKEAVRIFRNTGTTEVIGRENFFVDQPSNPTLATARALKRARQLLGGREAKVRIYLGEQKREKATGRA